MNNFTINNDIKMYRSDTLNFDFNLKTGYTEFWGKTKEEDIEFSPDGNMITDIEVTTKCSKGCPFCYKGNTSNGKNMSFDTFKRIVDMLPETVTQIALGADSDCTSNPDIFRMMHYARSKHIIPNITIAECSPETAVELAKVCGAVSVSNYGFDTLKATVKTLHEAIQNTPDATLAQINIHQMLSTETIQSTVELIKQYSEIREYVDTLILLSLKQRGRGTEFTQLPEHELKMLLMVIMHENIKYGLDSCTACKFTKCLYELGISNEDLNTVLQQIESCESTLMSAYFNVDGTFYPCSFNEEEHYAVYLDEVQEFKDLWYHPRVVEFRNKLLSNTDKFGLHPCPSYTI